MKPLIEIKDLSIEFTVKGGKIKACDKVTLDINKGEILGIIGESGSGKSTLATGILNLVQSPGKITEGTVYYYNDNDEKVNLVNMSAEQLNGYRWSEIATVFQAAQNALNPVLRIKDHFLETVYAHDKDMKEQDILDKAEKVLKYVRLDKSVLEYYPHQLSGGMKQRVLIALSLILDPKIIILDEPTTALDVITQWYIMELLKEIHQELGITLVFLTHDISIISEVVDRIAVMYAGQIVECGDVEEVFTKPSHPYTKGLLNAIPTLHDDITKRKAIPGNSPNLLEEFTTCKFAPRCYRYLSGECKGDKQKTEEMYDISVKQRTRCYTYADDIIVQKEVL